MQLLRSLRRFYYLNILGRKYFRSGKCNRCGRCCEKIYVKHGKKILKDEDNFKKLQNLHAFYTDLEVVGKDDTGLIFRCKQLDPKTRLCKNHKKRDRICRDYPQEEIFTMGADLSENCGYKFTPIIPFSEVLDKVMKSKKGNDCKFFID